MVVFHRSISLVKVYSHVLLDGKAGGVPHVHFMGSEAYVVVSGNGEVETLSWTEGFRAVSIFPGCVVVMSPGVIHRLVNKEKLEVVVVMENAGLAEAGDLEPTILDNERWDTEWILDSRRGLSSRDLAVQGFCRLIASFEEEKEVGRTAITSFFCDAAGRLVTRLAEVFREGRFELSNATRERIDAINRGDLGYLKEAELRLLYPDVSNSERPGFCGMRLTLDDVHG
ncbi:MAG TPA: cupin domain-containing protein [Thermoanaerobaculia bacterium]|jgi:mannose-6-phosphate isomerase-like protein (cupin superfamily)|nr:cupin domain-containing protein [Thermoanaerobaculia bacterium]